MSEDSINAPTVSLVTSDRDKDEHLGAQLCVVYPASLAQTIPLARAPVTLGRNPDDGATPPLRHGTVSRQHFAIEWSDEVSGHVGRDLQSRNGSWIDGERAGAKPVPLLDGVVIRLGDVLAVYERSANAPADSPEVSRDEIPGNSLAIQTVRATIVRAARDPSPALLIGETGTGKERTARELHRLSDRPGPFVAINCAALSPQLIESQLFGHEKGSFTGATTAAPGVFRAANDGTLFLDEIGELPLDMQPKLLRAIQEGDVMPVGSSRPCPVDVRIVAATNRDLSSDIEAGRFRRDLYARLSLWQVTMPALRQRRADVLGWVGRLNRAWLAKRPQHADRSLDLEPDAAESLLLQDWHDNLRGVDRVVHELASTEPDKAIGVHTLPVWLEAFAPSAKRKHPLVPQQLGQPTTKPRTPDRDELVEALASNNWSIRATAKQFDRDRRQIYRWMASLGIDKPSGEDA